jgi:hypothetical protein
VKDDEKREPLEEVLGCALLILAMPFQMVLSATAGGYTLAKLWAWFFVPFFAAPALGAAKAAAVLLVINFVTAKFPSEQKKSEGAMAALKGSVGRSLLYLVFCGLALAYGSILRRII